VRRPKGRRSSARCLACRLRWCACPICTARGSVPLRKSSFLPRRSIARAFSALPEGGRRSSAAGMEMGRSRRRAVGRRHGDGRRRSRFGWAASATRASRAHLTSAHRSAMSWGDMTRRRGGDTSRAGQINYATLVTPLEHGQHRHCHSQSHTLYRHSTALTA
jgi:hypothetical protein